MKKYIKMNDFLGSDDISKVSLDKLDEILNSATREGDYRPLGCFYAFDPDARNNPWIAIDNDDGCAWTEEFPTEEKAIAWLRGEFEVGDGAWAYDDSDDDIFLE